MIVPNMLRHICKRGQCWAHLQTTRSTSHRLLAMTLSHMCHPSCLAEPLRERQQQLATSRETAAACHFAEEAENKRHKNQARAVKEPRNIGIEALALENSISKCKGAFNGASVRHRLRDDSSMSAAKNKKHTYIDI